MEKKIDNNMENEMTTGDRVVLSRNLEHPLRYCSHCTEALAQQRALRWRPGDFVWAQVNDKAPQPGKNPPYGRARSFNEAG